MFYPYVKGLFFPWQQLNLPHGLEIITIPALLSHKSWEKINVYIYKHISISKATANVINDVFITLNQYQCLIYNFIQNL